MDSARKHGTVVADVYLGPHLAGHFVRLNAYSAQNTPAVYTGGAVEFSYTPEAAHNGWRVASTLPLDGGPWVNMAGALPPYFSNLLPEGRRLTSLKNAVKTSADNELDLLLAVGANTVGAVSVVRPGEAPVDAIAHVDLDHDLDFSSVLADSGIVDPVAMAGVQDKASARTIAAPVHVHQKGLAQSSEEDFILKVSPPEYPMLVENERECFAMAEINAKSFPVSTTKIIHDVHGRSALLVSRFDRVGHARLPVEDAAQILGIYPADKYSPTMEDVAAAVMSVTSAPLLAARTLAYMVALAWLTGNGDLHAKNISVLDRGVGYHVAPIYDIPSTLPYGDTSMALTVQGRRDNISAKIFRAFATQIGLPELAIDDIMAKALRATAHAADRINAAIDSHPRQRRDLERILRHRRALWGAN